MAGREIFRKGGGQTLAQGQFHSLHFALRPVEISLGRGDITLVTVKDGQRHAELSKPLRTDLNIARGEAFKVVVDAAPQGEIGDPLDLRALQRCPGSLHPSLRDFKVRAFL